MPHNLETLLTKSAIIERINTLFIATDARDWPRVRECFCASVLFDMSSAGGGVATPMTPEAIPNGWEAGLKPLQAIHHQSGNFLVTVEGDRATAFCYGIASHYLPNKSGANTRTFVGSYDFELQREADAWRISMFRFNLKYIDGNPNLESS